MNRLGNESSLYLRQHAENPVAWQPWDKQALNEARERDLPILLSIGYSACHWCHVMAHESFEDDNSAELMNRYFVNIKVDREERPDLDRIYQLAHQLLTGRGGGWPLTVFLEPVDHVPFFAGTYFPRERRYGMPAFREVLQALQQWYRQNRDEVNSQNEKLRAALTSIQSPTSDNSSEPDLDSAQQFLQQAAQQIYARHDVVNGGFGGAPKFPQAPLLDAVARIGEAEEGKSLHESLKLTLERMALSGLRDHLDGGFFRYCVDDNWTIPHFEKMLYDNAQLLPLYAEGARRWNNRVMKTAAEGIAVWLESDMQQPSGGYAASIDADAGGEEGGFHVWTREQIESVLAGKSLQLFKRAYGMDQPPNFEGRSWHLQRRVTDDRLAEEFKEPEETVASMLEDARKALHLLRSGRVHPTLDKKLLTSWNALLAGGWVRAGLALQRNDWLDRAQEIFAFIQQELWTGDGLLAVHNEGQARLEAYLDDYAWLLDALTCFLQARWNREWLDFAIRAADALLKRFEDKDHGGFFFSDAAVDVPITRSMIFQDDATPSGNAIAIVALNRLGRLTGDLRFTEAADRCLARAMAPLGESLMAHSSLLSALRDSVQPPAHLVISGTDAQKQSELKQWAVSRYQVDCYVIGPADGTLPGILREYQTDDPVTAWLCRGLHCLPPVRSRDELEQLLK